MRLDDVEESQNVEDRRAEGGGRRGGGLVLGGGIGTLLLVVIVMFLGGDPKQLLDMAGQQAPQQEQSEYQSSPEDEKMVSLVKKVLSTTEEVWEEQFRALGRTYEKPRLVLFSNGVRSGCGFADAQVGPFYCPADKTIYVDLSFFRELSQRFGAPGDFAQAYVIAHEVGHHVQKLLGTSDQVHQAQSRVSEAEKNELSVRLELQADFLAGVWARKAHEKFQFLENGDLEEAMNAANAIGDDTLQKQAQGRVVPDSFTHGTSQQRMRWFRKGVETGDVRQGDTFRVREL
ncbi:MAG: metalloprotease [Akkermansiaceae bacterium]|nr:metalloprotease [Akkermansiaceae bacterium]